jgi:hypothetical protein
MWQVSSRPKGFFEELESEPPRVLLSLGVALLSYLTGAFGFALAFLRLTASDAALPVLLIAALAGSLHLLFLWSVGGFLLQIPAELEGRAWEVAGWSWSPLLFIGLAALPLALLLPFLAVVLIFAGFLIWHSLVVNTALQALVPGRVNRTFASSFLVLFGLPIAIVTLGIYAVGAL